MAANGRCGIVAQTGCGLTAGTTHFLRISAQRASGAAKQFCKIVYVVGNRSAAGQPECSAHLRRRPAGRTGAQRHRDCRQRRRDPCQDAAHREAEDAAGRASACAVRPLLGEAQSRHRATRTADRRARTGCCRRGRPHQHGRTGHEGRPQKLLPRHTSASSRSARRCQPICRARPSPTSQPAPVRAAAAQYSAGSDRTSGRCSNTFLPVSR